MKYSRLANKLAAAAFLAAAMSPVHAADRMIGENYALSADETVDGVLTVAAGATVDLNGHNLTVKGLAGDGAITAGLSDLTSPDPQTNRVTWVAKGVAQGPLNPNDSTPLINLFNDNYVGGDNTKRVLVQKAYLPLAVTYDFGADTPKKVDLYKVYVGPLSSYYKRGPKAWTFEGSNDRETWTALDSRNDETWPKTQETRSYTFENAAAYRYYRMTFTESSDTSTANGGPYLEFVQLEYFDTASVPEFPPELRVNVPDGASVTNSTVAIGGSVRLVKEGAGEFVAARAVQMYSGGTYVMAGTLKPYSATPVDLLLGPNGSDVFVDSGATFDINGNSRCSLYHYRMNGGTALNSGAALGGTLAQLGDMTLTADSYLDSTRSLGFQKALLAPLTINLGGKVLQAAVGQETRFINADITNGTLRLVRGTGANTVYFTTAASRAPTATLDMDSHVGIYYDLPVSNLLLRAGFTAHSSAGASGEYKVSGTFRTETTNFPLVMMLDGSTVDLKSWSGTFNSNSTNTNPNRNRLMFADGATVTIDLAGRSPEVGERIIAWDEMPNNVTFLFDAATAAGGVAPVVADGGLLYGYVADAVEQAWWTGAAGDGDTANPANWLCKNAVGGTVEGATPSSATHIYLEGTLNALMVPAGLAHRVCTIANATLAGDCDLRAFGANVMAAPNSTIDLNGHRLYLPAGALAGTCTVKDAEIAHEMDLTAADASRVTSSAFNNGNTPASNLFNNNYVHGDNTKRVLVPKADWPLVVTYDFGEGKVVDAYRMWAGPQSEIKRMPKRWKFEGSDDGESWTLLDKRCSEFLWPSTNAHRTYSFSNTTAYRRYRITLEENCGGADIYGTYLELVQLEYFNLKPAQGELHLEAAEGESVDLAGLALAGNMRLFLEGKDGNGNIKLTRAGQTYVGGTEVEAGLVTVGSGVGAVRDADILGEKGSEVVVRGDNSGDSSATSGTVDFGGRIGYTGYKYVLDGGMIVNSGDDVVAELRLESDSYMKTTEVVPSSQPYGICSSNHMAYADLGGHELSVRVAGGKWFALQNATLENGILNIVKGGWFATANSAVATNGVSFKVACAQSISGAFSVADYVQSTVSASYNLGNGEIDVYGKFQPSPNGLFHGTVLHDGATIDLGALSAPLNVVAAWSAGATGARTLKFEPGATIGVDIGDRNVPKDVPVISWNEATRPDATVKFVQREGRQNVRFVAKEDGLYVESSGLVIFVR